MTAFATDAPAWQLRRGSKKLKELVHKEVKRKRWLEQWQKNQEAQTPFVKCFLPLVERHHEKRDELWGALIDAAIAATPHPVEGRSVEVHPPFRGRHRLTEEKYDAAVVAPTARDRWFTPRSGWPDVDFAGGCPPPLMPSERESPGFYLPDAAALGELRVELLETDGLPAKDLLNGNDVYALVLFEDIMACTQTIKDVNNPRWHCDCARAFRFPIHSAHATLFIALFDSDDDATLNQLSSGVSGAAANLDQDDPIGRVVLEVRQLVPGTTYDSWIELRKSAALDDAGENGAVRVRYSVAWASEPRRLRAALSTPPRFVLPLANQNSTKLAPSVAFAVNGDDFDDETFSFYVFLAHVYEVKDAVKGAIFGVVEAIEDIVTYKCLLTSALACVLWQAACSYPQLLPACGPLSLLALLKHNYLAARSEKHDVQLVPSFMQLLAALLVPGWRIRPITAARPAGEASQAAVVARRAQEKAAAAKETADRLAAAERLEKDLNKLAAEPGYGVPSKGVSIISQTESVPDPTQLLEPYLGWVQVMFGGYVLQIRDVHSILCWSDPALSMWLCVILALVAAVLPLLPWLLICRGTGILLLGPHMALVGRWRRQATKAAAAADDTTLVWTASGGSYMTHVVNRYALASSEAERQDVVSQEHVRRAQEAETARIAAEKSAAALPFASHAARRRQASEHVIELQGSRTVQHKFSAALDPARSSAAPL